MFRRKTDLVYSTLQQVQRRMTNQTETPHSQSASRSKSRTKTRSYVKPGARSAGAAAAAAPSSAPAAPERKKSIGPFTTPQVRRGDDPAFADALTEPEHFDPQEQVADPAEMTGPGARLSAAYGHGIVLNFPMLCVLLVLWILSVAIAYSLGPGSSAAPGDPGVVQAAGTAGIGPSETEQQSRSGVGPVVPTQDRDYLVLKSVRRFTSQALEEFKTLARKLNKVAVRYPDTLKPYFGVRKTRNQGLQLIFGVKDGVTGVNKDQFPNLKQIMINSNADNERGFPDAYWSTL